MGLHRFFTFVNLHLEWKCQTLSFDSSRHSFRVSIKSDELSTFLHNVTYKWYHCSINNNCIFSPSKFWPPTSEMGTIRVGGPSWYQSTAPLVRLTHRWRFRDSNHHQHFHKTAGKWEAQKQQRSHSQELQFSKSRYDEAEITVRFLQSDPPGTSLTYLEAIDIWKRRHCSLHGYISDMPIEFWFKSWYLAKRGCPSHWEGSLFREKVEEFMESQ